MKGGSSHFAASAGLEQLIARQTAPMRIAGIIKKYLIFILSHPFLTYR
jgi:hypothetical protein